jgi:hypothetical protein
MLVNTGQGGRPALTAHHCSYRPLFLAYASVHGHALIDRELYLPAIVG